MAEGAQRDAKQPEGPGGYHVPVLLQETTDLLNLQPGGVYVDCTFGGGSHSRAILDRLREGRLIAFDQDADAKRNLPTDDRLLFIPQNFRHIGRFLRLYGYDQVDGILADLGISSHQINEPGRGFSTRFEGPLDMRMDQDAALTAADLLNRSDAATLHKIFERYGEVTNARTLAHAIEEYRQSVPLKTIAQFKDAVQHLVRGQPARYFAQVFQALRIAVNDEMGALEELLQQAPALLRPGGRIAAITFHSIEDRMVKNFFKYGQASEPDRDAIYGRQPESPYQLITRKPITPSEKELKENPRSRSAKLRVAMRKPS